MNIPWFINFVLSLTCALLATLILQWVRRYLQTSQCWYTTYKRAQIQSYEPSLQKVSSNSIFLFFGSLVDFLININHMVTFSLLSAIAVLASTYFLFIVLPCIYPNLPYQTPLRAVLWMSQQMVLFISPELIWHIVRFIYKARVPNTPQKTLTCLSKCTSLTSSPRMARPPMHLQHLTLSVSAA